MIRIQQMKLKPGHTPEAVEEKAARIALGLGVADGSIGYDEILDWIISHKIME